MWLQFPLNFSCRIENGFIKQEMKRQSDDFARQLEEKERQLRRNVEDQRSRYFHIFLK